MKLGIAATVSLGVPFLLIAVAQRAMSTPMMAAVRVVLAAAVLALLLARSGRSGFRPVVAAVRAHPVAIGVVGLTTAVLPNLLIGAAERHVPSGTAAVILATTPLWIALGALLIGSGERFSARQWLALPAAIAGVALATGAAVPTGAWGWCVPLVAVAVSYAVSTLAVRRWLAGVHALPLTAAEMCIGAVVLVPFAAVDPGALHWDPVAWGAVVAAGIGCSGLGWMAYTALLQRVGAARASVVAYPAVVVSVLLGAVVLHEPVDVRVVAGTVIVVASVALFLTSTQRFTSMLELCILGFLASAPMHAYELRRRISALTGHVRPVSDGALNPALKRLAARGLVSGHAEPGVGGPQRIVFRLTAAGRGELRRRLAEPADVEITDRNSFFVILAFLHELPEPEQQQGVLRRRLAFIEEPGRGFFVAEEAASGPFRAGMTTMARATWTAERAWLRRTLDGFGALA